MTPRQRRPKQQESRQSAVPAQRPSELEQLGLAVEELPVDEHEARDARLHDALDWQPG